MDWHLDRILKSCFHRFTSVCTSKSHNFIHSIFIFMSLRFIYFYSIKIHKKILNCIFLKTLSANAISHTKVGNNHLRVFSFKHEEIGKAILHSLSEMHFVKLRLSPKILVSALWLAWLFESNLKHKANNFDFNNTSQINLKSLFGLHYCN